MTKKKNYISVIVPAYNEEKSIARVLRTLINSKIVNEVVCVNDGSTDKTEKTIRSFRKNLSLKNKKKFIFINYKKNKGKGYALARAIKKAQFPIVIFVDADLLTFSEKHILILLKNLNKKGIKAVLGYPQIIGKINFFPYLTGERAYYRKNLLPHLKRMSITRFGVELFLNNLFLKKEQKILELKNLHGLYKQEKHGLHIAFYEFLQETKEIIEEFIRQTPHIIRRNALINEVYRTTNIDELLGIIKEIKNKKLKNILKKYLLQQIKNLEGWVREL